MRRHWRGGELGKHVLKEGAAVFKHLLEIASVRSENLDIDFIDAMLQHFLKDFLFLGREFKALHNLSLVAGSCPLRSLAGVS
jgi:hypothetical protein